MILRRRAAGEPAPPQAERGIVTLDTYSCMDPGIPVNGGRLGHDLSIGASVTFGCEPGYRLSHEETLVCERNHFWNNPLPTCDGERQGVANAEAGARVAAELRHAGVVAGLQAAVVVVVMVVVVWGVVVVVVVWGVVVVVKEMLKPCSEMEKSEMNRSWALKLPPALTGAGRSEPVSRARGCAKLPFSVISRWKEWKVNWTPGGGRGVGGEGEVRPKVKEVQPPRAVFSCCFC
ncbi:LOW QUALITY PROTEIN: hypothetical protein CRUP_008190 [Coryphaenoides rupestris]|nr:LOW QUALITY PROTEIN: hypothetical protein CRUP_008190 [Coryphaenoides rupestris]